MQFHKTQLLKKKPSGTDPNYIGQHVRALILILFKMLVSIRHVHAVSFMAAVKINIHSICKSIVMQRNCTVLCYLFRTQRFCFLSSRSNTNDGNLYRLVDHNGWNETWLSKIRRKKREKKLFQKVYFRVSWVHLAVTKYMTIKSCCSVI